MVLSTDSYGYVYDIEFPLTSKLKTRRFGPLTWLLLRVYGRGIEDFIVQTHEYHFTKVITVPLCHLLMTQKSRFNGG